MPTKTHENVRIKLFREQNGGMNLDNCNANNHDFRPIDKTKWITNTGSIIKMPRSQSKPILISESVRDSFIDGAEVVGTQFRPKN